jgi:two-component system, cell cycle sensor histidine kinase and response regulator CckA
LSSTGVYGKRPVIMTTRTILIVDDETDILRVLDRGLKDHGFDVRIARNGDAAMKLFSDMSPRPDLLITDVVMPGLSGPVLADRLLAMEPNLKVLFMTGYDDRQVVRKYVVDKGYQIIVKPFTIQTLRQTIESVLAVPKAAAKESGS